MEPADHRRYLTLGGIGFMLGDAGLRYGRESVSETYYTAHIIGGIYLSAQLSFVNNPGFNRDRGPVVFSASARISTFEVELASRGACEERAAMKHAIHISSI